MEMSQSLPWQFWVCFKINQIVIGVPPLSGSFAEMGQTSQKG
jgi:hypothetical protein